LSVTLRIFISSPGDVAEERQRARDLIERLNKGHLLKGRVRLEAVSWDDPDAPTSMPVNLTPQDAVNRGLAKPSDCDIVVVLFWNRMGTELAPSEGLRANGEPFRSGTEWEFEDALNAPTQPERPVILLYRRTGFSLDASDPDDPKLKEQLDQRRKVNGFFDELRQKKRFATEVASSEAFEEHLENDLEHQISLLLDSTPAPIADTFQQATGKSRSQRLPAIWSVPFLRNPNSPGGTSCWTSCTRSSPTAASRSLPCGAWVAWARPSSRSNTLTLTPATSTSSGGCARRRRRRFWRTTPR
jgi:Domain of unknown function (DUF4062)